MKILLITYLLLTIFSVSLLCEKDTCRSYDNHRVYTIPIKTKKQLKVLKEMEKNPDGYIFWDFPTKTKSRIEIQVPPHKSGQFDDIMKKIKAKPTIYIDDLQTVIDNVQPKEMPKVSFGWSAYYSLDDIYAWLNSVAAAYPSIITKIIGGSSYEGRKIEGIKISYKRGKKGIFIESGTHAREWITPAVATFIANELITSDDVNIRHFAENFDWYIIPSINPDGYEFSHTSDRLWRKNRSPQGEMCKGVDLNRNWEYGWNISGVSSDPCSVLYNGPHAFSEIETKSLSEYYLSISDKISIYVSLHSFGQAILIPFGYSCKHIENYDLAMEIGKVGVEKMKERYGTEYRLGAMADVTYLASGTSIDWVNGVAKTTLSYLYELRDKHKGKYGFLLPAEQIIPTSEETLDSVCGLLSEVEKRNIK